MKNKWFLIANPKSGRGKLEKSRAEIEKLLQQNNIDFEWHSTKFAGEAMAIAEKAVNDGFTHLISAGGDGTLHEVANGVMRAKSVDKITIGAIPVGTGNDWAKSFNYPTNFKGAVERIAAGKTILHDIGVAEFQGKNGPETRYFINIAGLCYDAFVTLQTNIGKANGDGGKFFYLKTILKNLFSYENTQVNYEVDGKEIISPMFNFCVGINCFNGDGVKQCPNAKPDDGLLDVTAYTDMTKWELISNLPHLPTGAFVKHKKINTHQAREVKFSSTPQVLLEADGEDLGSTPARFTLIEKAVKMIV